jgi:arabinose-5-phosphate isomerase
MHTEAKKPIVALAAPMADVLAEMSAKELGMTTVVDADGRMVGVITDGDLRRLLELKGELAPNSTAEDSMTHDPVCVGADALATEALRLMEEKRITSLPVVDAEQRPEGVVHLHDLWRTEMI